MLRDFLNRHRLTELGMPLLLLALPTLAVFWLDAFGGLMLLLVAFGIGWQLRPKHLWIIWIGAIVLWWLGGGAWALWGDEVSSGEAEETVLSFMIEAIPFTGIGVLLPMVIGRLIPGVSHLLRDVENTTTPDGEHR